MQAEKLKPSSYSIAFQEHENENCFSYCWQIISNTNYTSHIRRYLALSAEAGSTKAKETQGKKPKARAADVGS